MHSRYLVVWVLFTTLVCVVSLDTSAERLLRLKNASLKEKLNSGLPFIEIDMPLPYTRAQSLDRAGQVERLRRERKAVFDFRKKIQASDFAEASDSKPRMAICVIGQLGRLELGSKVANLIQPNFEIYQIDILLIVAPTSYPAHEGTESGFHMPWNSVSITDYIKSQVSSNDTNIYVDNDALERATLVVKEYEDLLRQTKPILTAARVQSHVRHWFAAFRCWRLLSVLEGNQRYSVIVKLRDDSFVFQPWFISTLNYRDHVLVPECMGWGGYNDKVAVLDGAYKDAYFGHLVWDYYFNYTSLKPDYASPESMLKAVLTKYVVDVVLTSVDDMPVYTSVFENSDVPCFIFSKFKFGSDERCYPSSCLIRRRLHCLRCKGTKHQMGFSDAFLKAGIDCDQLFCPRPSSSHKLLLNLSLSMSTLRSSIAGPMDLPSSRRQEIMRNQASLGRGTSSYDIEKILNRSASLRDARRNRRAAMRRQREMQNGR